MLKMFKTLQIRHFFHVPKSNFLSCRRTHVVIGLTRGNGVDRNFVPSIFGDNISSNDNTNGKEFKHITSCICIKNTKNHESSFKWRWAQWLFIPVVGAFNFGKKAEDKNSAAESTQDSDIVIEADRIYQLAETKKLYDHLSNYKDTQNGDIMWRLARATCDMAKHTEDKESKKRLMYEAYEYGKQALALNEENYACHKWFVITMNYVGDYEDTKTQISRAYTAKEHLLISHKLNPKDATVIHCIGYWCFTFADLPWYQRKIAEVLFATPPSSSYEEALQYFLKAEEVDPNFYSLNLLMLGKTCLRMKNDKMALLYLTKAREYPVITPDDKQAHDEAVTLLKKMGVKDIS